MAPSHLPVTAAWQHTNARNGFEVADVEQAHPDDDEHPAGHAVLMVCGTTTAVEGGAAWIVSYRISVDSQWRTREAHVHGRCGLREHSTHLLTDGEGRWQVDGQPAEHLTGCLDVDLESSALTNTLPVHRLALRIGQQASAPAAYVRALGLRVERLEQSYTRLPDVVRQRYAYSAPDLDFTCELIYGDGLLVQDYPGIASRVPVTAPPPGW